MCVCYGGMKKSKHIFISRKLASDSIFRQKLTEAGYTVEGQSLIEFQGCRFKEFPKTDWIFLYSAKAAAFFLEGLQALGEYWPPAPQVATIGQGTANWLLEKGIQVDFVGNGSPQQTSQQFLAIASGKSVLFPQASRSRSSIEHLAGEELRSEKLIVYENTAKVKFELSPPDLLTFTSPLNAKAYFQKFPGPAPQPIVVIGQTTKRALEQLGQQVAAIASEPREAALAKAVLHCLRQA